VAPGAGIGKTLVSSAIIDRVAASLARPSRRGGAGRLQVVRGRAHRRQPGVRGEESAGATFLRRDGTVWTTDKDGIMLDLLAAEITAKSGKDLGDLYAEIEAEHGESLYERIDVPIEPERKAILASLSPESLTASELAGEPIERALTRAPGNDAAIGGLKVETANGWFAARPSGTENVYKVYAESFRGEDHLRQIQEEAQAIVAKALEG
jgi:phosphoglucomutase